MKTLSFVLLFISNFSYTQPSIEVTFYDEVNSTIDTASNSNGKINGDMTIFDESGNPRSQCSCKKTKLKKAASGLSELLDNVRTTIHYPLTAIKNKIEGTEIVIIALNKQGQITYIKSIKHVDSILTKETMRALKHLPELTHSIVEGNDKKACFTLAIRFKLN